MEYLFREELIYLKTFLNLYLNLFLKIPLNLFFTYHRIHFLLNKKFPLEFKFGPKIFH
jgi:hypothetical protein